MHACSYTVMRTPRVTITSARSTSLLSVRGSLFTGLSLSFRRLCRFTGWGESRSNALCSGKEPILRCCDVCPRYAYTRVSVLPMHTRILPASLASPLSFFSLPSTFLSRLPFAPCRRFWTYYWTMLSYSNWRWSIKMSSVCLSFGRLFQLFG